MSSQQQIPVLYTKEIQDLYIRTNFQRLVSYFSAQNQLTNFNFFELVFTDPPPLGEQFLAHGLGYVPKDILVTHITGAGKVEFKYANFTNKLVSYTVTGPCRIRFFVGTYWNDSSQVSADSSEIQIVGNGT